MIIIALVDDFQLLTDQPSQVDISSTSRKPYHLTPKKKFVIQCMKRADIFERCLGDALKNEICVKGKEV